MKTYVASINMISRFAKPNPVTVLVLKMMNQSPPLTILIANIYLICPKMSSLFLDGTHLFGSA
jgi:hypothetical protein